jgi:phage-related protein
MSQQQVMVVLGANIANFQSAMNQVQSSMQHTASQVQSAMNGASSSASQGASGIQSALKGIAGTIATAFAVDKIIDFGKTMLDTTADLQSQQSQYDQVMGGMKDSTDKYLDQMSKKWNKHPNELKGAYMQYVAILKSKGMSEADAHATAKKYLDMTVDANAFANEDMKDTTARFMGGIKGEYDSLDTAMVNLNATMLDDKAKKQYGKGFDELTVAQQETLKTQEMLRQHTSAGVFGQGAREADSYANNLAMVKNTWNELLAKFGSPVLSWANDQLKGLTGFLKGIDVNAISSGFKTFGDYIANAFSPALSGVKDIFQNLWDSLQQSGALDTVSAGFSKLKDVFNWLTGNGQLVGAIITGIAIALGIYAVAMGIASVATGIFNAVLAVNPITWIIVAIGALIGIIILLWKNWDSVSKWLAQSWAWIKGVASNTWNGIKDGISSAWSAIINACSSAWNGIKSFLVGLWNGIKSTASGVFNGIKDFLTGVWNGIKSTATSVWNSVKSAISSAWEGIKSAVSNKIEGIKSTITGLWTKAKEIAGNIKSAFTNLFSGIKVPHFSMSGSLNPKDWIKGGLPKLNVSWHANGGIVKGSNGGTIVGVGENGGDEAILPLSNKSKMKPFAEAVGKMMPESKNTNNGGFNGEITVHVPLIIDGREIAKATAKFNQEELDKLTKKQNRLNGQN